MIYLDFLFLYDPVLEGFMFLRIYPFLLGYLIIWNIIVHSILLQSFVFLWYWFKFLFFHFWFYLSFLSFLMSLGRGLSVLFIFSKNQLLVSLICFLFLFSLYFISFCSNLYLFHLYTPFGLCFFFFLVPLYANLDCFVVRLFCCCFSMSACISMSIPVKMVFAASYKFLKVVSTFPLVWR